ncbi:MAG: DUF3050 domain-containing protein, partial [Endozoicomonas sp.]
AKVNSMERLAAFMEAHVFAVWDFMSLAKRLQIEFTQLQLPWTPVPDSRSARFINEIILYEETDKDNHGIPSSHLEMYLSAMREVSADTSRIESVLYQINQGISWKKALQEALVPGYIQEFVTDTLTIAQKGTLPEVASYFLFGREDAIPEMFTVLLKQWGINPESVPAMTYYLERHIELDSNDHGPAAESLLKQCINSEKEAEQAALEKAHKALESRIRLWDALEQQLDALPSGTKETAPETAVADGGQED